MSDPKPPLPEMPGVLDDAPASVPNIRSAYSKRSSRRSQPPRVDPPFPQAKIEKRSRAMDGSFRSVCQLFPQGVMTLIELVRPLAKVNREAATFIDKFDHQSSVLRIRMHTSADRLQIVEDLLAECEATWPTLVNWAFESALATGQHLASIKAALALPEVVEKTIQFAKREKGHRDRDFLFRATGFIPTPGGISIVNQVAANAQARNLAGGAGAFVPFERDIIDATPPAPPAPAPLLPPSAPSPAED